MTTTGNWDFFIYAFFFIAVFIYGMAIQKGMSIVMIISVYLALGITVLMSDFSGATPDFLKNFADIKAIIFASSVFIISYYMISNGPLLSVVKNESGGVWWEKVLYGFAFSGLFVVTLLFLATPDQQATFTSKTSETIQNLLMSGTARRIWSIFPFAIFFLTNKS